MDEIAARDALEIGLARISEKRAAWDYRERYRRGDHDLPYAPEGVNAEYLELRKQAVANWLPLVANAPIQRLRADGFRTGRKGAADQVAWSEVWQANKLDSRQRIPYRDMMWHGRGLMSVWPNPKDRVRPVIRTENGRRVHLEPDPDDPWTTKWVVKTFTVDEKPPSTLWTPPGAVVTGSREVGIVYDDVSWHRFERSARATGRQGSSWERVGGDRHEMGEVPFVAFDHEPDADGVPHSAIEPLIQAQDAINTIRFLTLLAMQFAGFRQRAVTGFDPVVRDAQGVPVWKTDNGRPDGTILLDAKGNKIPEVMAPGRVGVDRILAFPGAETRVFDIPESNLDNYIKVLGEFLQDLFAVGQTPPQYLLNRMANLPLDLGTVVPTPDGRTTMGELAVGDKVYDPSGEPVEVIALSPIYHDRDCYRLTFDDGTDIVADGEHQWTTTHFQNPAIPYGRRRGALRETSVVTTTEIAASLRTSMDTYNHFIPVAQGHDGPAADLPIDPYALGVWLGDGDRANGLITSHVDDAEEMAEHLRAAGELVHVRGYPAGDEVHRDCRLICIRHDRARCPYGHHRPTGTKADSARCVPCAALLYRRDAHDEPLPPRCNSSFRRRLSDLDVLGNKHIPEAYFHGSFKQRLGLLQGLMDTDGTVKRAQGSLELSLHDERLVNDAHRLIRSLGHRVKLRATMQRSARFGIRRRWRMTWSSPDIVFRLARKAALQRTEFGGGDGRSSSPFRRYIISVEPVESRPVRCITVDSASHLFCVTDSFIATHNSGDALSAAESTLKSLVVDLQLAAGESLEQVMRLGNRARGEDNDDVASEVIWADAEAKSFAQVIDGIQKLVASGFPKRAAFEMIPGATPPKVDRWMGLADEEAEKAAARDPATALKDAADAFRPTTPPAAPPEPDDEPTLPAGTPTAPGLPTSRRNGVAAAAR